jgi:hypothetical protein
MKGVKMKTRFISRFGAALLAAVFMLSSCASKTGQVSSVTSDAKTLEPKASRKEAVAYLKAKKSCESSLTDMDVRRKSCLQYFLTSSGRRKVSASVLPTFKMFCNLEGVSCSKNGVKFGKGQINEFLPRRLLKGDSFRVSKKKTSDHYEYMAVQ